MALATLKKFIDLKGRVIERESQEKSGTNSKKYHLLIYLPMATMSGAGPGQSQEPESPSGFPGRIAWAQVFGGIFLWLTRYIHTELNGRQNSWDMNWSGSQGHNWQLNSSGHNAGPSFGPFKKPGCDFLDEFEWVLYISIMLEMFFIFLLLLIYGDDRVNVSSST